MSFFFFGTGQSMITATFLGSIHTWPFLMITPRNSTLSFSNLHFAAFRYSLFSCRIWNTLLLTSQCSSTVSVNTSISYTFTTSSQIRSLNILFMKAWKVAREFVNPKNMTVGSNSLLLVWKATFHLSPSLIHILLYPHQMSILDNTLLCFNPLIISPMSGNGHRFFLM